MTQHLFGIAAVIGSVALLISSIGDTFAYPQGPNVSLGSNPIVTLSCFSHNHYQNIYQVPTGMTLVITDFHIGSDTNGYIRVGNTSSLNNNDNILRHHGDDGGSYNGVAFNQNGHTNVGYKTMSVGLR